MLLKEEPSEYRKNNRHYFEMLIGVSQTNILYKNYDNDNVILQASEQDYLSIGITKKNAELIVAAKNINKVPDDNIQIRSSNDCYKQLFYMGDYNVEHFVILLLNRHNKVVCKPITISMGGLSSTVVDTKVLFQKVLQYKRVNAIILAHNHPSNNDKPSEADIDLTKKIVNAASMLDIKVLDHLIITENGYYSFADNGIL